MKQAAMLAIEVLEDGTITIDTDKIPTELHVDADKMVKEIQELLGGPVTIKQKRAMPQHTHKDHSHIHHNN